MSDEPAKEELRRHLLSRMRELTYPGDAWKDDEIIQWYRQWRLEDVRVADDMNSAVFVWRDPADGQRYAWRLNAGVEKSLRELFDDAVDYLFQEDLFDTVASQPDAEGVRWLGVVRRDWDHFHTHPELHPRMA